MAHLIDKDTLVAEIERLENKLYYEPENFKDVGAKMALDSLKSFLNTLEVKDVDLDKEIKSAINEYYNECEKKLQEMNDNDTDMSFLQLDNFAKHFFELGLKAKQKNDK